MTHQATEAVELGPAEALIEIVYPIGDEEMVEKYESGAVPYIEFE